VVVQLVSVLVDRLRVQLKQEQLNRVTKDETSRATEERITFYLVSSIILLIIANPTITGFSIEKDLRVISHSTCVTLNTSEIVLIPSLTLCHPASLKVCIP